MTSLPAENTVMRDCDHLRLVRERRRRAVTPSGPGCRECLADGEDWVHLRLCLTCGHVGCCDDSPHRHATAHARAAGHPVIRSYEPGESWAYCYADDRLAEIPPRAGELAPRHFLPPEHAEP